MVCKTSKFIFENWEIFNENDKKGLLNYSYNQLKNSFFLHSKSVRLKMSYDETRGENEIKKLRVQKGVQFLVYFI